MYIYIYLRITLQALQHPFLSTQCVHVNPLHLHARDKAGSKPDWPTL